MKRDLNCWSKFSWTVYFLWAAFRFRFIACIQIQCFRGRFIFLHLSALPRQPRSEKTLPTCFVLSARTTLSWRMETLQRARNFWRLNSQILQDDTFVHYPFSYWTFLYLLSPVGIFFPVFVCFDILWHLAKTHAPDNTRDRDANRSRQNEITWFNFCRGNHRWPKRNMRVCMGKLEFET